MYAAFHVKWNFKECCIPCKISMLRHSLTYSLKQWALNRGKWTLIRKSNSNQSRRNANDSIDFNLIQASFIISLSKRYTGIMFELHNWLQNMIPISILHCYIYIYTYTYNCIIIRAKEQTIIQYNWWCELISQL